MGRERAGYLHTLELILEGLDKGPHIGEIIEEYSTYSTWEYTDNIKGIICDRSRFIVLKYKN